jgi:hypothetical protein
MQRLRPGRSLCCFFFFLKFYYTSLLQMMMSFICSCRNKNYYSECGMIVIMPHSRCINFCFLTIVR